MTPRDPLPNLTVLTCLGSIFLIVALIGVAATDGFSSYPRLRPLTGPIPSPLPSRTEAKGSEPATHVAAFDSRQAGLAPVPDVGPWTEVTGSWIQHDGTAQLSRAGGSRSLAIVSSRNRPSAVQVRLATIATNAGLVVRYHDATHYVMLIVSGEPGTLWLAHVDGDPTAPVLLAAVDGVPLRPGIDIGVRIGDGRLTVVVNGAALSTVLDPSDGPSNGFGLIADGTPTTPTPRFDNLKVSY